MPTTIDIVSYTNPHIESLYSPTLNSIALAAVLVGQWGAGERFTWAGHHFASAHTWVHLCDDGKLLVTMRQKERDAEVTTTGRWWLEGEELALEIGGAQVISPVQLRDDILHWAGEVFVRISNAGTTATDL